MWPAHLQPDLSTTESRPPSNADHVGGLAILQPAWCPNQLRAGDWQGPHTPLQPRKVTLAGRP